jgi:hypothetical protein
MTTTAILNKSTKRSYLVAVEGIPGTWRTFSGGAGSASVTKDYDGGSDRADLLAGPPEWDDIEVVRTVAPARDDVWIEQLRKLIGRGRFNVTKQATDANWTKIGKPTTYPNCLLIGLTEPETDASSSDAAEVTLTFATSGPA